MATRPSRFTGVIAFALAALHATAVFAWGDHYLITDRILDNPDMAYTTTEIVKVESLDDFLRAQPAHVARVFDDYYTWLASTGSRRFTPMTFDPATPDTAAFLKAARLNPTAFFPLVDRLIPGDKTPHDKLPLASVSPYLTESDVFIRDFRDVTGQEVSARAVLRTFVDEPDWGIDQGLWAYAEYGYGEEPYGTPDGESSKAAFHMKFAHESFFVRRAAPEISQGMTQDRMELFSRLAEVAFSTHHPYWGYRFTAWSLHYIQDLAQPYHSRAVPNTGFMSYVRYAFSRRKNAMKTDMATVEGNRHGLYEDFVAYTLQEWYLTKGKPEMILAAALLNGDAAFGGKPITVMFLQDQ